MSAAPGYYPDNQGTLRWWNGQTFTEQTLSPPSPNRQQPQYVSGLTTGQHIGHGIATLFTLGLWAPVWALAWWLGRRRIR